MGTAESNLGAVGRSAASSELLSERIAPGILPQVLGPFDMVAIFVAIVLFANQASVIQAAGPSAFVYWILGFVTFLIPGAIVTGQLGLMFPGEGSIYVWTNKALGSFWGFFAGFCAWWPESALSGFWRLKGGRVMRNWSRFTTRTAVATMTSVPGNRASSSWRSSGRHRRY